MIRSPRTRTTFDAVARAIAVSVLICAARPTSAQSGGTDAFERFVRPILARSCYACHSEAAGKRKGGLTLDTHLGRQKGGDSGAPVVPGDPEKSLIVRALSYGDPLLQMPPSGKLAAAEIEGIVAWVKSGAADPADEGPASAPASRPAEAPAAIKHWAFEPRTAAAPPEVADPRFAAHPIDRFLADLWQRSGLKPAAEADRRTLIRRVTQDLTGLYPTDDEVRRFVDDTAPDAWEKVVDRLLASPQYGVRQARRWLDLARYADSNGQDENLAIGNAWRYRDWVVRAKNADLPYDRFLLMQIAGDLLPPAADLRETFDQKTATGFLVLGPKMLAEQDKKKLTADIVDEQIDVISKSMLGLTASCARCHDHKFDPVTQADYYALAGIFFSTQTMRDLGFVSRWRQVELATPEEIAARDAWRKAHGEAKAALDRTLAEAERRFRADRIAAIGEYLSTAQSIARASFVVEAEEASRTNLIVDDSQYGTKEDVILRSAGAPGTQFAEYDFTFPFPGRYHIEVRMTAAESRPMRVLWNGRTAAEKVLGEVTGSWMPDGETWFSLTSIDAVSGRNTLRLECASHVPHLDVIMLVPDRDGSSAVDLVKERGLLPDFVRAWIAYLVRGERKDDPLLRIWRRFATLPADDFLRGAEALTRDLRARRDRGETIGNPFMLAVLDGPSPKSLDEVAARHQTVFSVVATRASRKKAAAPKDATLESLAFSDPEEEAVRRVVIGLSGPLAAAARTFERLYSPADREAIEERRRAVQELEKKKPRDFDMALAVADGEPADSPIFLRGSHLAPAKEKTPRGFIAVLEKECPGEKPGPKSSGRLELARWITDAKNPLTARVFANRIWSDHFSRGIVNSPSNFGVRGEPPIDRNLLDWLAGEAIRLGWSEKALRKEILMSRAYRLAAAGDPASAARDPEGALFARHLRRRLDAESLRDSVLFLTGRLDQTIGGAALSIGDGDYVTNDQSADAARYGTLRRTLYLPVIRNAMFDLFTTFDYADSSVSMESRPPTIVPAQALYALNAPIFIESADALAERLLHDAPNDMGVSIDAAYRALFGRSPTPRETELGLAFIADVRGPKTDPPPAPPTAGAARPVAIDPAERRALGAYVQTLLMTNEFFHVE